MAQGKIHLCQPCLKNGHQNSPPNRSLSHEVEAGDYLKAAILYNYKEEPPYNLKIEDVKIDKPKAGEALIRVVAAGICHSCLHAIHGTLPYPSLPFIPGDEFVGYVEEVGPGVSRVNVGDMVVATWVWPCGKCRWCLTGKEHLCPTYLRSIGGGVMLDGTTRISLPDGGPVYVYGGLGGYAEYAVVPEVAVHPLPPELRKESSAILGCAAQTAAGAVMNTAKLMFGESVAIFGLGGLGLIALQISKALGAYPVIGVDIIDEKLKIAKELGADIVINAREKDSVKGIREITNGGVDVAFEFIGLSETISNAINSVKRGGRVVIVGATPVGATIPIHMARVVGFGVQILGNYGGRPRIDLPVVFELIKRGLVNIDKLVTGKYRLEQINEAFEDLEKGKILGRSILVFK